jgi:CheY-like chemotaxis protein
MTSPAPTPAPVILIVDDNDDTRLMYQELLGRCGFRVRLAADGKEAIASADEVLPAVIVMDLAMPGLNGWEATRRLKTGERTRDVPVIVLTAHALEHYRDVAVAAGCDEFLSKPCAIEDLVAAIRRNLPAAR